MPLVRHLDFKSNILTLSTDKTRKTNIKNIHCLNSFHSNILFEHHNLSTTLQATTNGGNHTTEAL